MLPAQQDRSGTGLSWHLASPCWPPPSIPVPLQPWGNWAPSPGTSLLCYTPTLAWGLATQGSLSGLVRHVSPG